MFVITFFNNIVLYTCMIYHKCVTCMELHVKNEHWYDTNTQLGTYTQLLSTSVQCTLKEKKSLLTLLWTKQLAKKHINSWSFWAKGFLLALIVLKIANSWDHHHMLSQQKLNLMDAYIWQLKVFVCYLENSAHLYVWFLISVAHLTLHAKVAPHYNNTIMNPAKHRCCLWWLKITLDREWKILVNIVLQPNTSKNFEQRELCLHVLCWKMLTTGPIISFHETIWT